MVEARGIEPLSKIPIIPTNYKLPTIFRTVALFRVTDTLPRRVKQHIDEAGCAEFFLL